MKIDKRWIRTQLEALPYILAACAFCGVLWALTCLIVGVLG